MNDEDTAGPEEIKQRLVAERERLEGARDAVVSDGYVGQPQSAAMEELSTVDQHPADIGTETFYMERDQSLLEQVRSDLDDVDAALRRLEEGTYGRCEACGEPIGDDRLEAVPAARFCLAHQEAAENGGQAGARIGNL
ncbi:MAG TPA: TraR/DksA C4-type zinc finger protein [Acidimicrobiales bacterium]|nr:TraR/DksA C4-type zinc finger protein [Acidimicrobiales bacterium]